MTSVMVCNGCRMENGLDGATGANSIFVEKGSGDRETDSRM